MPAGRVKKCNVHTQGTISVPGTALHPVFTLSPPRHPITEMDSALAAHARYSGPNGHCPCQPDGRCVLSASLHPLVSAHLSNRGRN
jgi:hypothetical protein